jgi:threonine/homoserine/homoserine lactone efflux protein
MNSLLTWWAVGLGATALAGRYLALFAHVELLVAWLIVYVAFGVLAARHRERERRAERRRELQRYGIE